jgi:hypothetical protein
MLQTQFYFKINTTFYNYLCNLTKIWRKEIEVLPSFKGSVQILMMTQHVSKHVVIHV